MNIINVASSTLIVITPIVIIVLIGYFSKKKGWLTEKGTISISKFVFYIALPSLIIDEVSKTSPSNFLELKGPIALAIVSIATASLGYFSAYIKKIPPAKKGVWAQSSFRGNIPFIGTAITINAIGEEGFYYCSINIAIGLFVFNTLSVIFLSIAQENNNTQKDKKQTIFIHIVKNILRNPMTVGVIVGVLFSLVKPTDLLILDVTIKTLREITLPLALIAMGAQINFKKSINIIPKAIIPIIYKVILSPIIGGLLLFLLGAKPHDFITAVIFLGAPTATLSYIIAAEMKGDHILALNIIFGSTLISFFTYTIMLFILGVLGIWEYNSPL